jgi:uncharacterized protein YyaL (SSP411 family)
MAVHPNHLIHETSPYLLQHAHNPVNWYPWSEQSLKKAQQENKPILVSIGYAACHWCHVMEKESFEDESIAAIMNEHFINIKIDREERPDLDHIYMNAVQTMTGSGGWPLNVFLTPAKKPFYGGTYFPPSPAPNRPSWQQVLQGVIAAFKEKRNEIEAQAENLTGHLLQSNAFGIVPIPAREKITTDQLNTIFDHIMQSADTRDGGFGRAPKFPQTFTIQFLLRHFFHTKNDKALHQALLSLDKMIYGGIYDQLGGGFARYATDSEWLAPHFEKMLYDNALLIIVLSEAYQLTQNPLYANTVQETMDFIERELMSEEGGFFSALDADSEGVEGKYYVWDKKEVEAVLQENATIFCRYYDITDEGNWEQHNILRILQPLDGFAAQNDLNKEKLQALLNSCKTRLLEERNRRIPPLLDDKILLSWNALMNVACCKAFAAFGDERYKRTAQKNMAFLLDKFKERGTENLMHTYKNGVSRHPAFLDDYAFLVQALICLQEITGEQDYLLKAKQLTGLIIDNFSEEDTGFFFYTHRNQQDVILRIKEIYDGATPSGNSIMAWNLHYLSLVFNNAAWKERALNMCASLNGVIVKYPTSFGIWASVMNDIFYGLNEIAVVGNRYKDITKGILSHYLPNKVTQSAGGNNNNYPLLTNRYVKDKTVIYLCRNYSCLQPVEKVVDLMQLIDQEAER